MTLDKYAAKAGLAPVVFDHWLHRSKYTCRVCHVDIGFAMQANTSGIRASTNKAGFHCGACHDGKTMTAAGPIFAACSDSTDFTQCARCHSKDTKARRYQFEKFTERFPRDAYGVDWEETEAAGLIKPIDVVEGVTIKKPALKTQADLGIKSRVKWASDVTFSHKKHTVWNGCELCHPEIFPATQKGAVKYTMFQISSGQYCGGCHGKVSFTVNACHNCHTNMKDRAPLKGVVVLPGPQKASGFGSVKFMHKTHVGDRSVKCEKCHHPPKPEGSQESSEQVCTKCHTRTPIAPVKTGLQGAFHNPSGSAGICIDCHKEANSKNFNSDIEFAREILPRYQGTIDLAKTQMVYGRDPDMRDLAQQVLTDQQAEMKLVQNWLKDHEASSWAPVKCRDCHKKSNFVEEAKN